MRTVLTRVARWVGRVLLAWVGLLFLLSLAAWWASYARPSKGSWEREGPEPNSGVLCQVLSAEGRVTVDWTTGWPGWDMLGISKSVIYEVAPPPGSIKETEVLGVRVFRGRPVVMQIYSPRAKTYILSGGGFVLTNPSLPDDYRSTVVAVPWRNVAEVTGLPVVIAGAMRAVGGARAWRRRRRARRGLCPACGYDLRASAGRCPECGAGAT